MTKKNTKNLPSDYTQFEFKGRGRSRIITITPEVRQAVALFEKRLIEMAAQPDETSEFDAKSIYLILNELDEYEKNILLAYYSIAQCSPTALGRLLGVNNSVICHRINKILNNLKKLNDAPKSTFNCPRVCIDY